MGLRDEPPDGHVSRLNSSPSRTLVPYPAPPRRKWIAPCATSDSEGSSESIAAPAQASEPPSCCGSECELGAPARRPLLIAVVREKRESTPTRVRVSHNIVRDANPADVGWVVVCGSRAECSRFALAIVPDIPIVRFAVRCSRSTCSTAEHSEYHPQYNRYANATCHTSSAAWVSCGVKLLYHSTGLLRVRLFAREHSPRWHCWP